MKETIIHPSDPILDLFDSFVDESSFAPSPPQLEHDPSNASESIQPVAPTSALPQPTYQVFQHSDTELRLSPPPVSLEVLLLPTFELIGSCRAD